MSNWEKSTEPLCSTSERQEKIIALNELEQNKKANDAQENVLRSKIRVKKC